MVIGDRKLRKRCQNSDYHLIAKSNWAPMELN